MYAGAWQGQESSCSQQNVSRSGTSSCEMRPWKDGCARLPLLLAETWAQWLELQQQSWTLRWHCMLCPRMALQPDGRSL